MPSWPVLQESTNGVRFRPPPTGQTWLRPSVPTQSGGIVAGGRSNVQRNSVLLAGKHWKERLWRCPSCLLGFVGCGKRLRSFNSRDRGSGPPFDEPFQLAVDPTVEPPIWLHGHPNQNATRPVGHVPVQAARISRQPFHGKRPYKCGRSPAKWPEWALEHTARRSAGFLCSRNLFSLPFRTLDTLVRFRFSRVWGRSKTGPTTTSQAAMIAGLRFPGRPRGVRRRREAACRLLFSPTRCWANSGSMWQPEMGEKGRLGRTC